MFAEGLVNLKTLRFFRLSKNLKVIFEFNMFQLILDLDAFIDDLFPDIGKFDRIPETVILTSTNEVYT